MLTIIEEKQRHKRTIAHLVLEQHRLRQELNSLASKIGHAQNVVDLGIEVSPMAASDVERWSREWRTKLRQFEMNEFEKINARIAVLELELKIKTT